MTDVETNTRPDGSRPAVSNPYTNQNLLPPHHPFTIMKRIIYVAFSTLALLHFKFYHTILHSPNVQHEWFKVGLATTVAILSIKAYVEMYEGKLRKTQVNYQNFPQTTHLVMALILLSTVTFNVALWPHYGMNSPIILGIFFFGIILQVCMVVPTYVQNAAGFVALTFFLQEYS